MGGKRDKKKKLRSERKENEKKKQQLADKKAQKEAYKKGVRKGAREAAEEAELDAMLAAFAQADRGNETVVERPSVRANASFVAVPTSGKKGSKEICMFGGEIFNGKATHFFNDILRYTPGQQAWKQFQPPSSPPPRAAHQCVAVTLAQCPYMYMFGGEFSSPNGDKFRHFKDMWRFDFSDNTWEEIATKGKGPGPRSGHRMAVWKKTILMFGGFYDTYKETKYFNDLWMFDIATATWTEVPHPPGQKRTSPRSSCQLAVHEDTLYLFGGFAKEVAAGGDDMEGCIYEDVWKVSLHLDEDQVSWEKLKQTEDRPSQRVGWSVAVHKNRAVFFGGVCDDHVAEVSEHYNDTHGFDLINDRWFTIQCDDRPAPRTSAMAAVLGNDMYICGGLYDPHKATKPFTFDDVHMVSLNNPASFRQILAESGDLPSYAAEIAALEDEYSDDGGKRKLKKGKEEAVAAAVEEEEKPKTTKPQWGVKDKGKAEESLSSEGSYEETEDDNTDGPPAPEKNEDFDAYYDRTAKMWRRKVMADQVVRAGFKLCSDCSQVLSKEYFSKAQWKKGDERQCKDCTSGSSNNPLETDAREQAHSHFRRCSEK